MSAVSVVIPSRNESYLQNTILDLLKKAKGEVQVIVTLDGYWPLEPEIVEDPRVIYIHYSNARGMRNAINSGVAIAKGEFILKTDAHCMFSQDYDEVLKAQCEQDWVCVPRRYALEPQKWQIEERKDNKYPVDYYYLNSELHGVVWDEKNHDPKLREKMIDETCSNQGSVWFMRKDYFNWLELEDEEIYGKFFNEFQEVGFKCWLSGGKVMVNKGVWYAHWHKTESRGWSLPSEEQTKAQMAVEKWRTGKVWHKQRYELSWLIDRFKPVPTW
jgi:glycosyltransferase involved in cell wall biosynthesis